MFATTPPASFIRSPLPRFPRLPASVLMAALILGGVSLIPETVISAPASTPGIFGDLGAPLARVAALRLPTLAAQPDNYQALPRRSAELNALLERSVDALTHGEALASRDRLMALEADLRHTASQIATKKAEMAFAGPCASSVSSLSGVLEKINCSLRPSPVSLSADIRDLEGTIRQREMQIIAERDLFAAELNQIGLAVSPAQVGGLLHLASANDMIGLKSAYSNLAELTDIVRTASVRADHTPATLRRYYGLYTVMLEVAMHMHEDMYVKLQHDYLPRLDAITADSITTFRQAERLKAQTTNAAYAAQLDHNMRAINTTLRAAQLYRAALTEQAQSINIAWKALREQHQVAVNSWRAVNLSSDLLAQMEQSGQSLQQLSGAVPASLQQVSSPALQREFDRLTSALIIPKS